MNTVRDIKSAETPEFISILRPFSMFEFVENNFCGIDPMRRLMSQVRALSGATMIVEHLGVSSDIAEENEDLGVRYGTTPESMVTRVSFFTKEFSTEKGLSTATNEQFLGYAVIKRDQICGKQCVRVFESVLKSSSFPHNHIRRKPKWSCEIAGHSFEIEGFLYAQQNDMTNVCAHVALRSAASLFHPQGDLTYREINRIVGIDHINRKAGGSDGGGLSMEEMVRVLERSGARCVIGDYQLTDSVATEVPFHKYIYGSIESGFPSLLAFKTNSGSGHVIPVFGHTFNQDMWVCNAELTYFKVADGPEYIPSESWLSMYLAHDDNFGSNFCIPRQYLQTSCYIKEKNLRLEWDKGVAGIIGTLPGKVELKPIQAELIGADYLFAILPELPGAEIWKDRFRWYAERHLMVLRPILITKAEYIAHLSAVSNWNDRKINKNQIGILNKTLNDGYYWLVELSLPELFSANKRKVAEVLLNAEEKVTAYRDFKNFTLARLSGRFVFYSGGDATHPEYEFVDSGAEGHVELFGCEE
jgi:hypothetical protein